jgi:arylsulfatase A
MKKMYSFCTGFLMAISFCLFADQASAQAPRPNFVILLDDDMGYECINSYGGASYKTPNLTALANSGIQFQNGFSAPVCSPTRVQLLTGQYGFRNGWTSLIEGPDDYLNPTNITFGKILKDAGYAVSIAGKWQLADLSKHPTHMLDCGFDKYSMWTWVWAGKKTGRYWNASIYQDGALRSDTSGKYGPDLYRQYITNFITANRSGPFCAYYPMTLTHNPFNKTPDSPTNYGSSSTNYFKDMVAYADKEVGKVVSHINSLGLSTNTVIFFMGDNGTDRKIYSTMTNGKRIQGGKSTPKDTGSHVPFIVSWPGHAPAGVKNTNVVDVSDILPTMAELAGAPIPSGRIIDGHSMAPLLRGQAYTPRAWVFVQEGNDRFVRTPRWKLEGNGNLYDFSGTNQIYPDETTAPLYTRSTDNAASAAARTQLQPVLDSHR